MLGHSGSVTLKADNGADPVPEDIRRELSGKFRKLMSALYEQKGAALDISIIADTDAQQFITAHADALDSGFARVPMSDTMRRRLQRSDYIFSGLKTFHELNEAFPSLLDENGDRKPFEQFLSDVRKIDQTYNSAYLQAEYNFAQASAQMAAKWERFAEDGDRYNLQYRTAGDSHVRKEHALLDGITLPPSDPFWETYYPPNGWNCRCSAVQVRKKKYPETPRDEAMALGEQALQQDTKGMFAFNSGLQQKTFPDYNPYTIRRCRDCDVPKGKTTLAYVPENQLCAACRLLNELKDKGSRRRLNKEERKQVQEAALTWVSKHLPKVNMPDGNTASRLTVKTGEGIELHIGKTFFTETFAKNKNNRRLAKTMETATHVSEWIRTAHKAGTETGRHHNFDFTVFKANYKGQEIEFKAKMTEGLIVYLMRLI